MRESPMVELCLSEEQLQQLALSLQATRTLLDVGVSAAMAKGAPEYKEILIYERACCDGLLDQIHAMMFI